jgi:hypothetical protein
VVLLFKAHSPGLLLADEPAHLRIIVEQGLKLLVDHPSLFFFFALELLSPPLVLHLLLMSRKH